jgi:hypothetical protein
VIVVFEVYFAQQTYNRITICVLRSKGTFSSHEDSGDDERRTFYVTEGKKSINVDGGWGENEDGEHNGDL